MYTLNIKRILTSSEPLQNFSKEIPILNLPKNTRKLNQIFIFLKIKYVDFETPCTHVYIYSCIYV